METTLINTHFSRVCIFKKTALKILLFNSIKQATATVQLHSCLSAYMHLLVVTTTLNPLSRPPP